MRSECWWQAASVIEQLFKLPTAFEFIQATRLLRHVPYVQQLKYWADDFHFQSSIDLDFPQAEIESLTLSNNRIELSNLMLGLTGIQGVLPYTYTQKVKQAPRRQRLGVQHFLDLFNHQLSAQYIDASLFYNLPIRYELEQENHYLDILLALNGYIRHQQQQQPLDDYFAEFSGLMQGQNNSAYALKTLLSCVFKQQVQINQYIPEKFQLAETQQTTLGGSGTNLLGKNTFCGERIQQVDGKIEIAIGPLSYAQYLEYLPQQKQSQKLKTIITTWCSPSLLVDLRLVLAKDEIQAIQLSSTMSIGLAQGAFLLPQAQSDNNETCYALIGEVV